MPQTKANARFQEEFLVYHESEEWKSFMEIIVTPTATRFESALPTTIGIFQITRNLRIAQTRFFLNFAFCEEI